MSTEYPFCKIVDIYPREGNDFELFQWLTDQSWNKNFDYSLEIICDKPGGDPLGWRFIFDDARKAVAFKLVWG